MLPSLTLRDIAPTAHNRRHFLGAATVTAAIGWRGAAAAPPAGPPPAAAAPVVTSHQGSAESFDSLVKLCFNENPHGPSQAVLDAIEHAFRYANRYGYPDGGIVERIAEHHGVAPDHVLLAAGSTEILGLAARAFLNPGQRVLGVSPTFHSVYEFATGCRAESIQLPLLDDHQQDVAGLVVAANEPDANIGFVYLCNPNNPTGMVVPKQRVAQLLDGVPRGLPVLIDEAYHDFVDDPAYESAITHVAAGRPVVVARTFSKLYGLAGVRLGYAIAPPGLIARMNEHAGDMSVSALAKWAGSSALADRITYDQLRADMIRLRNDITARLSKAGFATLPSGGNFFMVELGRPVGPVIEAFRDREILVGRPFPPMNEHLRVSIGTPNEMAKFMAAFGEIMESPV